MLTRATTSFHIVALMLSPVSRFRPAPAAANVSDGWSSTAQAAAKIGTEDGVGASDDADPSPAAAKLIRLSNVSDGWSSTASAAAKTGAETEVASDDTDPRAKSSGASSGSDCSSISVAAQLSSSLIGTTTMGLASRRGHFTLNHYGHVIGIATARPKPVVVTTTCSSLNGHGVNMHCVLLLN